MFSNYFSVKKCWNEKNAEKEAKREILEFDDKNAISYHRPGITVPGVGPCSAQPKVTCSQDAKALQRLD